MDSNLFCHGRVLLQPTSENLCIVLRSDLSLGNRSQNLAITTGSDHWDVFVTVFDNRCQGGSKRGIGGNAVEGRHRIVDQEEVENVVF